MYKLFVFPILFLAIACGNPAANLEKKQAAELETLAREVMDLHDEVMPKTGGIFKLKKQLLSIADTLADSNKVTVIYDAVTQMEAADKEMMDWMHAYKEADPLMEHAEKVAYYKEEKRKMEVIREMTINSIENAKDVIADAKK